MARRKRPPPPPPRRKKQEDEAPFDPYQPPEPYAKPHHFAINSTRNVDPWSGGYMSGLRVDLVPPPDPGEYGGQWRYGNWVECDTGEWWISDHFSGSDYGGGCVNKSNYLWFLSMSDGGGSSSTPFWMDVYGGHGTYAIALHIATTPKEAVEVLDGLESYPLVSDEAHSELEDAEAAEAWKRWAEQEAIDKLEVLGWTPSKSYDSDKFFDEFSRLAFEMAAGWQSDNSGGCEMTVDVEEVTDALDDEWRGRGSSGLFEPIDYEEDDDDDEAPSVDPYAGDPKMPPPYYGGLPPRAPRTPGIGRDAIEKLRRAKLREGYDYNPSEKLWLDDFQQFIYRQLKDPYPYVRLSADQGTVTFGLSFGPDGSYPDPYERAAFMVHTTNRHYLLYWSRNDDGYYRVAEAEPYSGSLFMKRLGALSVNVEHGSELYEIWQVWKDVGGDLNRLLAWTMWKLTWWYDPLGICHYVDDSLFTFCDVTMIGRDGLEKEYPELFEPWVMKRIGGGADVVKRKQPEQPEPQFLPTSPAPEVARSIVDPYADDPTMPPPYYGDITPRPPRFPWRKEAVRQFRHQRFREGYDYNPRDGEVVIVRGMSRRPK